MNNRLGSGEDFRDEVLREQVRLAVKQLPAMQTASFIVALVLAYTVRRIVPLAEITAWVLMVLGVVAGRSFLYIRFFKTGEGPFDGRRWENAYLILALVSGAIWGLSAFMIFPAGNIGLICLFVLVMASLSAATTVSHSSLRLGPAAWAGPAMLPYAIRSFMEGGEFGYTLGVLIILYLATILRYSFTQNSSVTSAISLKFENLGLLDEVRKANDALKQDIIERKVAEEKLKESEDSFRGAFETAAIGMAIRSLEGRWLKVNRSLCEIVGYTEEELLAKTFQDITHPDDLDTDLAYIRALLAGEIKYYRMEKRYFHKQGHIAWILLSVSLVRDIHNNPLYFITQIEDITERKKAEEVLRRLSTIDGLTGLANRRALDEFLDNEWKRALRDKRRLSLMMIDIDFFKKYNDTYGHLQGDACLQQVAGLLKGLARRPGDMAARFGGEEFVVVLENADTEYAVSVAERMRRNVEALRVVHAKSEISDYVTASIGVATILPQQNMSPADLIRDADEALYKAKHEGRNRVSLGKVAEPVRHS